MDLEAASQELFAAARRGDLEMLNKHRGLLLQEFDDYPYSIWEAALQADQVEVLGLCLHAGLPADGDFERRPLIMAAQNNAVRCVSLLLQEGADPLLHDSDGRDLLLASLGAGSDELVKQALEMGCSPFSEMIDLFLPSSSEKAKGLVKAARRKIQSQFKEQAEVAKLVKQGGLIPESISREEAEAILPFEKGMALLHLAAAADNAPAIAQLARLGANLNKLDRAVHERHYGRGTTLELSTVVGGWTPLMTACAKGSEAAALALIDLGASVVVCDPLGETPIHLASRQTRVKVVEALLAAGADPGAVTVEGGTPLILASYFGATAIVDRLIHAGAQINQADQHGSSPLLAACWEGRAKIVDRLLDAGASLESLEGEAGDIWEALHSEKRTQVLKRLLPRLDLNPPGRAESPLSSAMSFGHLEAVPLMVKAGARLREGERIQLHSGWSFDPKAQRLAMEALRPILTEIPPFLLQEAIAYESFELVDLLLDWGVAVSDETGLLAQPLGAKMLRRLLDAGAIVNGQDEEGRTALSWAVTHSNHEAVRLLLDRGADPLIPDSQGRTPRDLAELSTKGIQRLFGGTAPDPQRVASLKLAELMADHLKPETALVEELLVMGGDPHQKISRGFDLVNVAAASQWWEAADLLIAHGALTSWITDAFLAVKDLPALADAAFLEQVMKLEEELGESATEISGGWGAFCFTLSSQIEEKQKELTAGGQNATSASLEASMTTAQDTAARLRGRFSAWWCGSWRCHPIASERLLLVPTNDPYVVTALIKPHAGEHDVGVFEILDFLKRHESLGWTLTGIGYDSMNLEFRRLPDDLSAFCQELYEFCPDLIDQGFSSLSDLGDFLVKQKSLRFWWD